MSATPTFRGKPVDYVVDVRSKLEFWMGHLPGAVCIPVDRVQEGVAALDGITPSSRILVYCASGARSSAAASMLKAAGYRSVMDGGGMSAASEHFKA